MKFFITFCASLVCVSLGEPGWFDSLWTSSDTNAISNDYFADTYSQTINHVTDVNNKIQDQDEKRVNSLPRYGEGTLGGAATTVMGWAKNGTGIVTHGITSTSAKVASSLTETFLNTGVDFLLVNYKLVAETMGIGSVLQLPDIESSGFLNAYTISATGGYFRSLSSLEKNGRINVTFDSEAVLIEIPMRFTELHVGYKNITATIGYFLTYSGNFSVDVENNSLYIKLRLGMDSTCAISVEEVKITELDGITVKIEGFNTYLSLITEWITNNVLYYMEDIISSQIQQAVDDIITNTLSRNSNICSKFIPFKKAP